MAKVSKKKLGSHKLYRNEGVSQLLIEGKEINPGQEFEAALDPDYEMQMLMGGHLVVLRDQSVRADQAQAVAAEGTVEDSPDKSSKRSRG